MEIIIKESNMWDYLFRLGVSSCVSHQIIFQDSLTINISGKDQMILVFFFVAAVLFSASRQSSREGSTWDYDILVEYDLLCLSSNQNERFIDQ